MQVPLDDSLSRAPPIPRALLQQCQTLITGPGGPQGVVGLLASGQLLVWVPCQEERLLPGPGSQCWPVAGCPGYRRVLCLSLSHLLEWRGEQWHLASLPQGHCPLQAHSAVWQESRQGWLVALVGREQEGDVRTVLSMLLQSHSQRHGGPARLSLEEGEATWPRPVWGPWGQGAPGCSPATPGPGQEEQGRGQAG